MIVKQMFSSIVSYNSIICYKDLIYWYKRSNVTVFASTYVFSLGECGTFQKILIKIIIELAVIIYVHYYTRSSTFTDENMAYIFRSNL